MSNFFIKRRPDANHKEIVAELEKRGVCVVDLAASGSGKVSSDWNPAFKITFGI